MRTIIGIILMLTSVIGIITIFKSFDLPLSYISGGIIASLLYSYYVSSWYKELTYVEQEYQKNIMHEEKIPVIGTKLIDWDEYRDIPKLDINAPLKFDRNKIYYEPKKPF